MWDYQVQTITSDGSKHDYDVRDYLNTEGAKGWELVSASTYPITSGSIGSQSHGYTIGSIGTRIETKMILKRPKPPKPQPKQTDII